MAPERFTLARIARQCDAWTTRKAELIENRRDPRHAGGKGDGRASFEAADDGATEVVLAERRRGDFFGESPVLLGADAFAGLRAVSDCRVLRLDPFDFQALTVLAPEFKAAILEAMMGRLSEIGTRATARKADAVLVVGHRWDQECRRVRTLLARNRVRHEYLVVENPAVMDRLPELAARGDGAYPVVRLIDGSILVQPSIRDKSAVGGSG